MARALFVEGQQTSVITIDSERPARRDAVEVDGIPVHYLGWVGHFGYVLPTSVRALASVIRRVDVVHCFGLYNFICPLALWIARREGKPFVVEPMGMYAPKVRSLALKRLFNATVTRWMAKKAAAVVATSSLERLELLPLSAFTNVVIRRNGIDVKEFAFRPLRSVMRERWDIGPDQKLVLYLGRISEKKQLRELVRAFLLADSADSKLVIVGPVSEAGYAARLTSDIERSVRPGDMLLKAAMYGDDLKAALSAADLFVLPSLNENFGNSAAEAVAADVPVLLTETCGIAPIIHERAGYAVPLGVERLADGLAKMLDPEFRDRMTACREEVKRELSWDEPIAQTIALYEKIIAESKK